MAIFVRAPVEGALNIMTGPSRHGKFDGRTVVLVDVEQMECRVANIVQG